MRKKVLLLKFSPLGELLLLIPAIKYLNRNNFEITIITKKKYVDLLSTQSFVESVVDIDSYLLVNYKKFDFVIDAHLTFLLSKEEIVMKKIKEHFNEVSIIDDIPKKYDAYISNRLLDKIHYSDFIINLIVNNIKIQDKYQRNIDNHILELYSKDQEDIKIEISKPINTKENKKIGFFIGASSNYKVWPIENFALLIKELPNEFHKIVFLPQEIKDLDLNLDIRNTKFISNLSLMKFAHALSLIDILVTNDSGPKHLASAVGTPTICLSGHSSPDSWRALGKGHIIIQSEAECSPCNLEKCPLIDSYCMSMIYPQTVNKILMNYLEEAYEESRLST